MLKECPDFLHAKMGIFQAEVHSQTSALKMTPLPWKYTADEKPFAIDRVDLPFRF